jgi:hypothetical protein
MQQGQVVTAAGIDRSIDTYLLQRGIVFDLSFSKQQAVLFNLHDE